MRTVLVAELRYGARRVIAPGVAIAISVAFVVLAFATTTTMKAYLHQSVAARATVSDVVVTPTAESEALPDSAAGTAAAVPGVGRVEPGHQVMTMLPWPDGEDFTAVVTLPQDPRLQWMRIAQGRTPAAANQVVVDADTARDVKIAPGATLRLPVEDGPPVVVEVVGIADLGLAGQVKGMRTVLAQDSAIATWWGTGPTELDVVAAPGADPERLRDDLRVALGPDVTVRTGAEEAEFQTTQLSGGVNLVGGILLGFASVSLVVATIVIANTFAGLYAQRVQGLALLRCLGATRRQVFRGVLGESTLMGALASAVGLGIGLGLSLLGVLALGHWLPQTDGMGLSLSWWMPLVAFGAGLVVTVVAAAVPARRSTRVSPLAALRPRDVDAVRVASRRRALLGLSLLVIGGALLGVGASGQGQLTGLGLGLLGGLLCMIGFWALGPVMVPQVARLMGRILVGWLPGRLAVGNAVRDPLRASATSLAVLVGVSLVTMMAVGSASLTEAADREIGAQLPLDLRVSVPDGESLEPGVVARLTATPGTRAAAPVAVSDLPRAGVAPLSVAAVDPAVLAALWRTDLPALTAGTIVMPTAVAEEWGTRDGGRLSLPAAAGGRPLTVTVRTADVPSSLLVPSDLRQVDPSAAVRQVWLRTQDSTDAVAYRNELRQRTQGLPGVVVDGSVTLRAQLAEQMRVVLGVAIGLLAVTVLIAVVGIANTLSLSVLERTRELAVQRALGMTRRQLRVTLGTEAVVLSTVGSLLGLGAGVLFGWAGALALMGEASVTVPLTIPWATVLPTVAAAVAAGALAAVIPSRRAARLAPAAALGAD